MKYFSFIALALGASLALAEPTNSSDSQKANIQELQKELEILRLQKELDSLKNANTTNPQSTHNLSKNEQKAQRKAQKQAKKQAKQESKQTRRNLSKNNFFLGLEVGGFEAQESANTNSQHKTNAHGLDYGFMLGGSHFFNKYVGLRYYGDIKVSHNKFANNANQTIWARHGTGLDLLANILATQKNAKSYRFGVFAGLYAGILNLSGTPNKDFGLGNINLAANAGLRMDMGRFSLEFASQIPFVKSTHSIIAFDDFLNLDIQNKSASIQANTKREQNFNLNARLIIRF